MTSPDDIISYSDTNIYGSVCHMTRRTAAHLDATKADLARLHPGSTVKIIQSAYNTGVPASAGTHDYDACLDVYIPGWAYSDATAFLRAHGWAAWTRSPPTFGWHIHMISLGYTARVGIYVPGQVIDYYNHRTGLVGHYADTTWHPADIDATVYHYTDTPPPPPEETMPTVKELLDADVSPHATVRDSLLAALDVSRALGAMRDNIRQRDEQMAADLDAVIAAAKDDATKADLTKLRGRLREDFGAKDTAKK